MIEIYVFILTALEEKLKNAPWMAKIFKMKTGSISLFINKQHSLIRGFFIQSCPAGAKNFTNYVFCHPQFNGVIQNIENHCAIRVKF